MVLLAVRHTSKSISAGTPDGSEKSGCFGLSLVFKLLEPSFDFLFGCIGRIKVRTYRLLRCRADKRLVVFDQRPRSLIEKEEIERSGACGGFVVQ